MMSAQKLMLVLSNEARFFDLQSAAQDVELLHANEMMAALGQYIIAMPHAILIDSTHPDAEATIVHLRSVDAEPILVLVDECAPAAWLVAGGFIHDFAVRTLPISLPANKVLATAIKAGEHPPAFTQSQRLIG